MAEAVPVEVLARRYGTPLYVYSRSHIESQFVALAEAMAPVNPLICYSVKVNTNAAVIGTFVELGSGADVVSSCELYRARRAGVPPSRIVFAGVGKTREEIEYALRARILFFTVESEPELDRIAECAHRLGRKARIALRANPDVNPETHHYISTGKKENKFGLDLRRIERAYRRAASHASLEIAGLHMHIGSQILNPAPFARALERVAGLCRRLRTRYPTFRYLDIGGGMGIQYKPGQHPLDPRPSQPDDGGGATKAGVPRMTTVVDDKPTAYGRCHRRKARRKVAQSPYLASASTAVSVRGPRGHGAPAS